MNQTNVFSGSRKLIPVSPYSKTQQPGTPPSAKHPLKKAVDKPLPKPKPVTTRDEANELLRNCQECVKEVRSAGIHLRRAVYEAYVQRVHESLHMTPRSFAWRYLRL